MQKLLPGLLAILVLAGLYLASVYNYLLFHTLSEVFSIVIACGIFMVAWNTRKYAATNYLLLIGIAYLFVGMLDYVHTLSYSGMNIFAGYDSNTATQLWIASRYLESLTLLLAPFIAHYRIRPGYYFGVYAAASIAVLASVFYWRIFPDCFIEGAGGLTPFKIISEYIICLILLASAAMFVRRREDFDPRFLKLLLAAIGTTILAELAFTTYASVFGFSNLLGHYLKIVSFALIYKAFIETGLAKPFALLFRDLDRQREWLHVTLTSIGDAVIATDTRGHVSFMNKVAADLTGWTPAEAEGKPVESVFRIVNEVTRETVENPVREVLRSGSLKGVANHTILARQDGRELPVDDSASPIRDKKGEIRGAVLVFRDISERREAEKQLQRFNETLEQQVAERTELAEARAKKLQSLAMELVMAEEKERRRISQVLHDDLQQLLSAGRLQLQTARDTLPESSLLAKVEQILADSINKSRSLSHELSPPVLQHAGLFAGLQWLVRQMEQQFGLRVALEVNAVREPEEEAMKTFVFRGVQELLFNVIKHAETQDARLNVTNTEDALVITVSDAGKGFDPDLLEPDAGGAGLGLLALRERTASIGGSLTIESAPGRGSLFTLRIPLGSAGAAAARRASSP